MEIDGEKLQHVAYEAGRAGVNKVWNERGGPGPAFIYRGPRTPNFVPWKQINKTTVWFVYIRGYFKDRIYVHYDGAPRY